jgi:hypothetical protein
MDITKRIKELKAEIDRLEKQKADEMKKSFPDIIGKIFKPSVSSLWKVKEVTHVFSSTHCMANVLNVTIRKSRTVEISTSYNVEIDILDMETVTQLKFEGHLLQAFECIRTQCM